MNARCNCMNYVNNNNGFTLIEALLTIFIVGIIVAPLSYVYMGTVTEMDENDDRLIANQLSQYHLEEMKSMKYIDLITELNGIDASGNVISPASKSYTDASYPGYTITKIVSSDGISSLYQRPTIISVPKTRHIEIIYSDDGAGGVKTSVEDSITGISNADYSGAQNVEINYTSDGVTPSIKLKVGGVTRTFTTFTDSNIVVNVISTVTLASVMKPNIKLYTNVQSSDSIKVNYFYDEGVTVEPRFDLSAYPSGSIKSINYVKHVDSRKSEYIVYEIGVIISKNTDEIMRVNSTIKEKID